MTRLPLLLATAALGSLALAACSKPAGETTTAAEGPEASAAPAAVASSTIQPGYWESTKVSPGEEPETDHDCVTAEDTDLKGQLQKSLNNANCTYTKQQVGGGRIDIEGTCAGQEGVVGTSTTKMSGTYTPTTYNMDLAISVTVENKPVTMAMKVTGKRVGDTCPAEE
jgi:hypothetical protein